MTECCCGATVAKTSHATYCPCFGPTPESDTVPTPAVVARTLDHESSVAMIEKIKNLQPGHIAVVEWDDDQFTPDRDWVDTSEARADIGELFSSGPSAEFVSVNMRDEDRDLFEECYEMLQACVITGRAPTPQRRAKIIDLKGRVGMALHDG